MIGRDLRTLQMEIWVYGLSVRALFVFTGGYKLLCTLYWAASMCFVCFGLRTLGPTLCSTTLSIVHLDGTPILYLHNICKVLLYYVLMRVRV
jgi:hypothetical protein